MEKVTAPTYWEESLKWQRWGTEHCAWYRVRTQRLVTLSLTFLHWLPTNWLDAHLWNLHADTQCALSIYSKSCYNCQFNSDIYSITLVPLSSFNVSGFLFTIFGHFSSFFWASKRVVILISITSIVFLKVLQNFLFLKYDFKIFSWI